ncbi:recombinase zinc beta ribbon domain-containing protein [Microbacterium lacticum]
MERQPAPRRTHLPRTAQPAHAEEAGEALGRVHHPSPPDQPVLQGRCQCAVEATQVHGRYLKGTIHCGQCGSRLIVSNAKNRHGNVHCYFVCSGRHSKRTDCTRQAMLIEDVEKLVEDYYSRVQITPAQQDALAGMLHHEFDRLMAAETEELERLTTSRDRLESEQDRLMQALRRRDPADRAQARAGPHRRRTRQGDPTYRRALRRLRRRSRPPR